MFELTDEQKEDLMYLRKMENIVIPREYTYWCHNTMYKPTQDCVTASDKRCWNEIPVNNFAVKREMSFTTRTQRINTALDYGNDPALSYANTDNSWPFQIRVLQPKYEHIKTVYEDEQDQRKHYFYERGLGDGRHPKLPGKTEVFIFAFAKKDDVSDGVIDIVYGVCKEDISKVANLVRKLEKYGKLPLNTNIQIIDNRAHEANCPTVLEKSKDYERFADTKYKLDGVTVTKQAGYKKDYIKLKNIVKTNM